MLPARDRGIKILYQIFRLNNLVNGNGPYYDTAQWKKSRFYRNEALDM